MEDNSSYTYVYEKNDENARPERSLKVIFIGVIAALAVLAVVLGIFFGLRSSSEDEPKTDAAPSEVSTTVPVVKTPYNTGTYSVNSESGVNFRKEPAKDAEGIDTIAYNIKLEITEVHFDENAEADDYMYWGKTEFKGHTGWVSMKYMKKAYSDNVITPEDISTTEAATEEPSEAEESTSAAQEEASTMLILPPPEEPSSEAEKTTAPSTAKYSAGDYKVSTGGTTLSFRKGPGTANEPIFSINDGEKLCITEIVDTGSDNSSLRYWGKATYKGHTGYVCMTYLSRVS